MTTYRAVAGFLFDLEKETVVLILKQRPAWQCGKLNGIGGKIETGESPIQAMRREFREETGLDIDSWREFTKLEGDEFEVHFFHAYAEQNIVNQVRTMTDEWIMVCKVEDIPLKDSLIENVRWLIPMALSMADAPSSSYVIREVKS